MTSPIRSSSLIWCICLRAASTALALAVMFLLVVVVSQSAQAQTYSVLYTFHDEADGGFPTAGLVRDAAGNLYGITPNGGTGGGGVVFKLSPTGKLATLHAFTYPSLPDGLIRDAAGNLYGTTWNGGTWDVGTVFKLSPTGRLTVLHNFGDAYGSYPEAGVVRDAAGNLYGTTQGDDYRQYGSVFKVSPTGKLTSLYVFTGGADGDGPDGGLIRDAAGNLYGTTWGGGTYRSGVVFKVDTTGHETVVYSFTGGADGASPESRLVRDGAGDLYGTASNGGDLNCNPPTGCGVAFKVDTTGHETVLYTFTGGADGKYPVAGVLQDAGNLYGTTLEGGTYGAGVVFELDTTGHETVLYSLQWGSGWGTAPRCLDSGRGGQPLRHRLFRRRSQLQRAIRLRSGVQADPLTKVARVG